MSADDFARWWDLQGREELRVLLMTHWDPIGVGGIQEAWGEFDAWDEYDAYLEPVVGILRSGANATDVAEYLAKVENQLMEIEGNANHRLAAATQIVTWYLANQSSG